MATTFGELREAAKQLVSQPMTFSVDDFIHKVEDWVNSMPEWKRNGYFGFVVRIGNIERRYLVRYTELPKVLREDPVFRERYIRALAGLPT